MPSPSPTRSGPPPAPGEDRAEEGRIAGGLMASTVAGRFVLEASRTNVSSTELDEIARADPNFAARLLAVANSPAHGRQGLATSVHQACDTHGVVEVRNIALSLFASDLVPAAEGAASLLSSCLRRAVIARGLAVSAKTVPDGEAFFAGLFLELGLLHQACDAFDECLEVSQSPGRHRVTRERALRLVPHPEFGAALATELHLPSRLIVAISQHHATSVPDQPLAVICWVTERCAAVLEAGHAVQNLALAETAASQIGVVAEAVQEILKAAPEQVEQLSLALESPAGPPRSERVLRRLVERDLHEMHEQYEQCVTALARVIDERDRLAEELEEVRDLLARQGRHSGV